MTDEKVTDSNNLWCRGDGLLICPAHEQAGAAALPARLCRASQSLQCALSAREGVSPYG